MKKLFTTFLILIIITFPHYTFAQIEDIAWQECFGTYEYDKTMCISKFNKGYLLGIHIEDDTTYISNYHGKGEIWIVNIDSIGNVLWEKCFGGSEGESPKKIIPINQNSVYLYNISYSTDGDVQNGKDASFWIVKIDSLGNILWENSYGNRSCDDRDALLMPDGGLLIMGRIMYAGIDVSTHYGANDIWMCRIDSIGNILWEKTFGNTGLDNAGKIKLTSNNTILMAGGHYTTGGMIQCPDLGTDGADVWIVEINLKGEVLNQWCYGGSHNDLAYDIIEIEDGYVFVGSTNSNDGDVSGFHGIPGDVPSTDIWVCKIDFLGNLIWQKCLGGSKSEYPKYITQSEDEGFVIISNTSSQDGDISHNNSFVGVRDVWVVKIDSIGELQWEYCYGGLGDESLLGTHTVTKNTESSFTLAVEARGVSEDVECEVVNPDPFNRHPYSWIINIKDCSQYQPATPQKPIGKDYFCVNTDSVTTYVTQVAQGAWYYEWQLAPDEAGTLVIDSITVQIHWSPTYEGQATIKVRSDNDCGTSAWSDSFIIQTYICLGTEENNTNNHFLSIYPNPASSTLTVNYNKPVHKTPTTIEIFNIYGTVVTTQNMEAQKQKTVLDISRLAAGLYFVRVIEDDILIGVKKVVVE
ncbi:MAG: T9SS type A sorting domain-containing protein [Bacteroidota bacterium]